MKVRTRSAYLAAMRRNIWKSYLFAGVRNIMLMMPIIVLFFLDVGLSMTQVFIAQAIFSLIVIGLEIPSGYISDALGRRRTLIAGSWFLFLGFLFYTLAAGFWEILIAEVLLAVGVSLISGTDTAMLYDTLLELREEKKYKRIEGKRQGLSHVVEAVSSVAGGLIAGFSIATLRTPFYFQAGAMFFLVLLAYTFVEPEVHRYRGPKGRRSFRQIMHEALAFDLRLKWLIGYSAVVGASTLTAVWLLQPYFLAAGLPIAWFGVVWAAMYVGGALTSYFGHKVDEVLGPKRVLLALMLIPLIASLALATGPTLWLLLFIPAYQIVRALQDVIISDYLNRQIGSHLRATIISTRNFLYRIIFAALAPFVGLLMDKTDVQTAFLWSGIIFFVLSLAAFLMLCAAKKR